MSIFVLIVLAINILLWKSGFLKQAERPSAVLDLPRLDEKERKAIIKRLKRWRDEGRLTRAEYEHFLALCDLEWDEVQPSHSSIA